MVLSPMTVKKHLTCLSTSNAANSVSVPWRVKSRVLRYPNPGSLYFASEPKSGSYPVAGRPRGSGEARKDGAMRSLM